jgi:hypothetical protein
LSCAFLGADEDEPYFKSMLNDVARDDPGVSIFSFDKASC